ncbi:hypothetical protein MMC07_009518 [Pseudocyphellaria aurata]|nr:hypothetical protein [Pseudocyphellaria aurata]
MSGLELLAVVACVAAVCSAYHDGAELVHQIKAKRKAKKALQQVPSSQNSSTAELEASLHRGEDVVRNQYDRDFRRFGDSFAHGDRECCLCSSIVTSSFMTHGDLEIARDALKDIIIHLQGQVISNLKIQWQQDTFVDFNALQDVSDASQDRAIMVLMQLQQRIITSAPIEDLKPPPLFSLPVPLNKQLPPQLNYPVPLSNHPPSHPTYQLTVPPISSASDSLNFPFPTSQSHQPSTPPSQSAATSAGTEKKGHFSTVPSFGFFSRQPKAKHAPKHSMNESMETRSQPPPIKSDQRASRYEPSALNDLNFRQRPAVEVSDPSRRLNSISTTSSGVFEPETPDFNPWIIQRSPSPSQGSQASVSTNSQRRVPASTLEVVMSNLSMSPKDLLPCESNKFAGFCKGAWRLQIGDKKKAMDERQRPGGMYSANRYWQCSKCKFEGRMVVHDKKTKSYDTRIFTAEGVQFRWEFLFKSHVESREDTPDPLQANFGCIFCCAEARGTPTFGGINSFMTHLQEHRDRLPTGEVLYRMNCLVGRRAGPKENFDINLEGRILEEI